MAANVEENVIVPLLKEVETLRETDRKLRSQEICCQKAKELFLLKYSATNQQTKEKSKLIFPEECQKDPQFLEMLQLLLEIKKLKRRLLMLKHQLHSEQVKQEVGVLGDILQRQSEMLVGLKTQDTPAVKEITPLAFWYSKIVHSIKELPKESDKGKFSEMSQLFFNVRYKNGEKEPRDFLAETIRMKKTKRNIQLTNEEDVLRTNDDDVEKLQFCTCYKGFCIQIMISKISNIFTGNEDGKNDNLRPTDLESYRCYSDIGLQDLQEHFIELLSARKTPEVFVREYIWKEVEKLAS